MAQITKIEIQEFMMAQITMIEMRGVHGGTDNHD